MIELEKLNDNKNVLKKLNLFLTCFPHLVEKVNLKEYAQKITTFANVIILKENMIDVGILVYYSNNLIDKQGYISLIGVQKEKRGLGFGQLLLEYCIEELKKKNMTSLKLEVDIDNLSAIQFYKKNDFFKSTENKKYNSIYMIKKI